MFSNKKKLTFEQQVDCVKTIIGLNAGLIKGIKTDGEFLLVRNTLANKIVDVLNDKETVKFYHE